MGIKKTNIHTVCECCRLSRHYSVCERCFLFPFFLFFFFSFDAEMFDGREPAAHQKNVCYTAGTSLLEIFMSTNFIMQSQECLQSLESNSPIQISCAEISEAISLFKGFRKHALNQLLAVGTGLLTELI